ncbi:hypothetical protein M8994_17430 [Brucella sp. 21LCYQ03]|nr:hypothetical protein [Brucella sp. 21LCYQ03]
MKNRIIDLNNHLFAQLERLSDEELTTEQINAEVKRTDAIVAISEQIISNADLALKAVNTIAIRGEKHKQSLPMIFDKSKQIDGIAE